MKTEDDVRKVKSLGNLGVFCSIDQDGIEASIARGEGIDNAVFEIFKNRLVFIDLDAAVLSHLRLKYFSDLNFYKEECRHCAEALILQKIKEGSDISYNVNCPNRTFYHYKYPESKDLYQELLSQNKIRKFNIGDKFVETTSLTRLRIYIKKCAYCLIIDAIRKLLKHFEEANQPFVDLGDLEVSDNNHEAFKAQAIIEFMDLLNTLEPKLRDFIVLIHDGRKKAEIMSELSLSESAFKKYFYKTKTLFSEHSRLFAIVMNFGTQP